MADDRDAQVDHGSSLEHGASRIARAPASLPPEVEWPFRLIAFDWDGTAVESRTADARAVVALLNELLAEGVRIVVITGTSFENVAAQLGNGIDPANARRLYICTNRGSEVFSFDRRGKPILLDRRTATADEDRLLDRVVDTATERLERLTGLPFAIVRNRVNRRKLDLIPEPEFRDPPKSAIGVLLAATEARLRGGGLRGGLREAFELMEMLAREAGLSDARVTSDVKHIEVGLTDKSDAMKFVFHRIADPLQISPEDVLILGDEFGPIAGFEGSDHKMLAIPEIQRARVVSVGPEPGGAPEEVVHLGGGPERFQVILERQLEVDAKLGIFKAPRDSAWVVEEPGFDVAREHEIESLLSIANGYVGSRGSLAEGTTVSRPATLLAGAFEASADPSQVPELVVLPDWGRLRLVIEGEPFSIENSTTVYHRRVLDMRRGVLLREGVEQSPTGRITRFRTLHVASLADRHLMIEGVSVCPENFSGTAAVDTILSGDVKSESGASHWDRFEAKCDPTGPTLVGWTRGGLSAALTSHVVHPRRVGATTRAHRDVGGSWAKERYEFPVRIAETHEVYRAVAIYSSRDVGDPEASAERTRERIAKEPVEALLARHEAAWDERWQRANVNIDGAPKIERALRFALYHLIAAANPEDERCSVGARSLSGQAYRGHVFWDTEIFMLPFYMYCYPEAARSLLLYRFHTLGGARRKAHEFGYTGALYAWESAETGDEMTPKVVRTPFGELVRVLSGDQEHHISADVAYAVASYIQVTGDYDFAIGPGLEILVETARLWASHVALGADGHYHIRGVIGPDEYHECIDDNAFTNWMARFNLYAAASAVLAAPKGAAAHLGVDDAEVQSWQRVADAMYLGVREDGDGGIIEQFSGYYGLEPINLAALEPRHVPVDLILGRERTQQSQVVKQADVVQLLSLLWDELPAASRRANFLYYEPKTAHGSSLSPGIHALVAARLGLHETATRYLDQTADIDLGNTMGNAAGGVHIAGLGSLWQAVVFGVAGVRFAANDGGTLVIEPNLPPRWRNLSIPLTVRGQQLSMNVDRTGIEVSLEGDARLSVRASGQNAAASVMAEPGRRYFARRSPDGFASWEAVS